MKRTILGLVVILIVGRDYDDDSNFYGMLTPTIGYFIKDNFAVGVDFGLGYQRAESKNIGRILKSYTYDVSAFGRYYFLELGKRFKFYGQMNLGYSRKNSKYEDSNLNLLIRTDLHEDVYRLSAGVGVNCFVSKKVAINFYLSRLAGYSYIKDEEDKTSKEFNFKLNQFSTSMFGIVYRF